MTWDWTPETLASLERFLGERGLTQGPVTTRRIGDGHSNLTFLVADGVNQVVVRRPPPPPTPPGAHDMLREARLIGALGGSGVPVAKLLATAQAGEVIDVPFYVMSFAAGLADMGRPEGFNARHLRRMARLVADPEGNPPPRFAPIDAWLSANVPPESGGTIVHNDLRIGNVVLAPQAPARVEAVLDWELATIGDPLIDVGYFLASVPEKDAPMTPTQELGVAMLEEGYPSRKELADRYAERTGRDLSNLYWYTAFVLWKLAVLYEYGRRRAVRGVGDPYYADQGLIQSFLEAAHRTAGLEPPKAARADENAR